MDHDALPADAIPRCQESIDVALSGTPAAPSATPVILNEVKDPALEQMSV